MKTEHAEGDHAYGHKTRRVQVWVHVDEGIAEVVERLNQQPDVLTFFSCEGYPGQSPAYIGVGWESPGALLWLQDNYVLTEISRENSWAYLHPFAKLVETRPVEVTHKAG